MLLLQRIVAAQWPMGNGNSSKDAMKHTGDCQGAFPVGTTLTPEHHASGNLTNRHTPQKESVLPACNSTRLPESLSLCQVHWPCNVHGILELTEQSTTTGPRACKGEP